MFELFVKMLFVFKAYNCLTPLYIVELLSPLTVHRSLMSFSQKLSEGHDQQKVDNAFAVYTPRLWNSLPQIFNKPLPFQNASPILKPSCTVS